MVHTHWIGNVEDAMLTILGRSHELSWGRSLLVVQLGVRQAFTVAEVVRTAVRVFGSVTECVTVAEGAKDGDTTPVLSARTALQMWELSFTVVPWDVPVGTWPGRSQGAPHLATAGRDKYPEKTGGQFEHCHPAHNSLTVL